MTDGREEAKAPKNYMGYDEYNKIVNQFKFSLRRKNATEK